MRLRKQVLILVGIIAVLSVYLYRRGDDRAGVALPAVPAAAAADFTRIEITRDGKTVELVRRDDRWQVGPKGYTVDRKFASDILTAVAGLKLSAVVAESKSYALYELDEERNVHVRAWVQDRLQRDFYVGKIAPSFRHTFVRLEGDERVFHAIDAIRDRFVRSLDDMRDKSVLAFNPAEITEIKLVRDGRELRLKRSADPNPKPNPDKSAEVPAPAAAEVWLGPDGQPNADAAKVEDFLKPLSTLNCEKYLPERAPADFQNPVLAVTLKAAVDLTVSLFAPPSASEDKSSPGVSSASAEPFLLAEFQVTPLLQKADELLAAATPK
jgi:hypothetical protein